VAVLRRARGNDHPQTLDAVGWLAGVLSEMGDYAEAQLLLEEALAGLRLALGDEAEVTLGVMQSLATVHADWAQMLRPGFFSRRW
jgi:hypothetical protein